MTPFGMWLTEIGLGTYDVVFASDKIDFDVIRSLSGADLRELGLPLGDRKRLRQAGRAIDDRHSPPVDRSETPRRRDFPRRRAPSAHGDVLRPGRFDGAE
jgi:SAM domain (Sterile alpha motif)